MEFLGNSKAVYTRKRASLKFYNHIVCIIDEKHSRMSCKQNHNKKRVEYTPTTHYLGPTK